MLKEFKGLYYALGLVAMGWLLTTSVVAESGPTLVTPPALPDRWTVGEPVELVYTFRWEDAPAGWMVLPPVFDAVDWATIECVRAETSGGDDGQRVTQTVRIVPREPGERTFPALKFGWLSKEQAASLQYEASLPSTGQLVQSESFPVLVREPFQAPWPWIAAGAVVLGAAGAAGAVWARRKRAQTTDQAASPADQAQNALHQARRQRLDGDLYGYYRSLVQAAQAMTGSEDAAQWAAVMQERARQVGYQGVRPPDDQLDGDLRDMERALRRFKEARET